MSSARWVVATTAGFALTGAGLHSPGASGVGASFLEWDVSAALFGAFLGAIAGAFTGLLQLVALRSRAPRILVAMVTTVAAAHALTDGAPASWGVPTVAAVSGLVAASAHAWAIRLRDRRLIVLVVAAWVIGWLAAVALARSLGLSNGSDPSAWATEHAAIGAVLGAAFGLATSPVVRRILAVERALSSVG